MNVRSHFVAVPVALMCTSAQGPLVTSGCADGGGMHPDQPRHTPRVEFEVWISRSLMVAAPSLVLAVSTLSAGSHTGSGAGVPPPPQPRNTAPIATNSVFIVRRVTAADPRDRRGARR